MLLGRFCFMTHHKYVTFLDKIENISSAKVSHTPWSMTSYSRVTAYILTILSSRLRGKKLSSLLKKLRH